MVVARESYLVHHPVCHCMERWAAKEVKSGKRTKLAELGEKACAVSNKEKQEMVDATRRVGEARAHPNGASRRKALKTVQWKPTSPRS